MSILSVQYSPPTPLVGGQVRFRVWIFIHGVHGVSGLRLTCGSKDHHHPYPSAVSHPLEERQSECNRIQDRDDDCSIKGGCVVIM